MRCEIFVGRRCTGKTSRIADKIAQGQIVQPILYFDHQHPFDAEIYQQKTEQRRAAVSEADQAQIPNVLGTVIIDDCLPNYLRHFEPDRRFHHILVVQNVRDVPPRIRANAEIIGEDGVPIDPFINDIW